jgi:3-hydroxyacyl-[acyl-carrier-protein] dehydratase
MTVTKTFEIREILKLVPHRWPMVMIDRVTQYDDGDTLTALKNVTYNESFFPGHFPVAPTMPGVLILEAMAQSCGIFAVLKSGITAESGMIFYFAGIDNARFKRPVVPGDQLVFHVQFVKQKRDLWKFACVARVDAQVVCEAEMMCVVRPPLA